jgi:hypothetical protein
VIFREMFLQGLTVLDIMEASKGGISMSHIAARQEVRDLIKTLKIATLDERLSKITKAEAEAQPEKKAPAAAEAPKAETPLPESKALAELTASLPRLDTQTDSKVTEINIASLPKLDTPKADDKVTELPEKAAEKEPLEKHLVELAS